MRHNQSGEDYLETILLLSRELQDVHQIDVARRLNVSQPAVLKALKILKSKGYIDTDGMHIYLTERGKEYAGKVYYMHCTLKECLLYLGVDEANADADACEIEHVISEETFSAIDKFVKTKKG